MADRYLSSRVRPRADPLAGRQQQFQRPQIAHALAEIAGLWVWALIRPGCISLFLASITDGAGRRREAGPADLGDGVALDQDVGRLWLCAWRCPEACRRGRWCRGAWVCWPWAVVSQTSVPEENAMKLEGGCYCGKVRYVAEGEPMRKGQCHCRECQFITGGAPNMFVVMPSRGLPPTPRARPSSSRAATSRIR